MAECVILETYEGWKKGDHVELFGEQLKELVGQGIVMVLVDEVLVSTESKIQEQKEEIKEKRGRGRPKKVR